MKKYFVVMLFLVANQASAWIDSNGVPHEGFFGYRGFWNRFDDLKHRHLFRDSNAQEALDGCNIEDFIRYGKATDFGRHPERLLKAIECNSPALLYIIEDMEDLDGTKFSFINTLIAKFDQLVEDGYEPECVLQKLIQVHGNKALFTLLWINSHINPDNQQHQELRNTVFNPRENSTLLQTAVEAEAHQIVKELLTNEATSDAVDLSLRKEWHAISEALRAKRDFYCDEDSYMDQTLSLEEKEIRDRECPFWEANYSLMQKRLRNQREERTITEYHEKMLQCDEELQKENARFQQMQQETERRISALLDEQEHTVTQHTIFLEDANKQKERAQAELRELLGLRSDDND